MAESSFLSWTTDGTGDGTLSGYTQAQWISLWRMLYLSDTADEGVFNNYLNELAVTNPSGRDLQVDTGGAIVYGFPYINSAAVTKTLTHPVVGTTGWRLVLRADWTAQTVRITLLESADGTATIPAMTQTENVTWDIPLATGTITTGDVVAVTDARVFVHPNIEVETAMLEDDAVTGDKIAAEAIDSDHYVDGSIHTAHIGDSQVTATKIANRTRTLFVPCTGGTEIGAGAISRVSPAGWPLGDSVQTYTYGTFYVPSDYVSSMTIYAVVYNVGSGNMYCANTAEQGAVGEAYDTHTTSSSTSAVAVTANQWANIKALTMSSIASGDYVVLTFYRNAADGADTVNTNAYFAGWLVSYTADS